MLLFRQLNYNEINKQITKIEDFYLMKNILKYFDL